MYPKVLIIAAVKEEVADLVAVLQKGHEKRIGNRETIAGLVAERPVEIVVGGPGAVNTAQTLTACIEKSRPSMILQTGCAGAFVGSGLDIGDVCVAECEIDAHIGLEAENADNPPDRLPFSILSTANLRFYNTYPLNPKLAASTVSILSTKMKKKFVRVAQGPFLTVATVTTSDKRAAWLYQHYRACMESMEGAAAAHVAHHYGIPFLEVRAASNRVGRRDLEQWNLPLAFQNCCSAVYCIFKNFHHLDIG